MPTDELEKLKEQNEDFYARMKAKAEMDTKLSISLAAAAIIIFITWIILIW